MSDTLISVGWVALDETGEVLQPMKKQVYSEDKINGVRKLYKTKVVASRYGKPCEVFIRGETE